MHLYGLGELKAKTLRSWGRVFGEELQVGEKYSSQLPTIAIAFTNGQVEPVEKPKDAKNKIHRICRVFDSEDLILFAYELELHYIDLKAFAKAVNEIDSISIEDAKEASMFLKWLAVITEKEINNKAIIDNACKDEEAIFMAMTALQRQSEDKIVRQAYQKRQDEIYFYNLALQRAEQESQRAKQESQRADKALQRAKQESQNAKQESQRADKAEKALIEREAIIAQLQAQLKNKN